MALALLAYDWVAKLGGRATALHVDHGLRAASAGEARQVAAWMKARGINHAALKWRGAKPRSAIQAAARKARYGLMTDWCRRRKVLHLLLAHHQEDQAETFMLRLERGSGLDGLACMAASSVAPGGGAADLRLLRPLLDVPKARLRATLGGQGQDWIDDPSNRNPAYARVRVRGVLQELAERGFGAGHLAGLAAQMRGTRDSLEAVVVDVLVRACRLYPAGYGLLDLAALEGLPEEGTKRLLVRLLLSVGGGIYPPRRERLERLHRNLFGSSRPGAKTLAGCRIVPLSPGVEGMARPVLICREPRAAGQSVFLAIGERGRWDDRFSLSLSGGRQILKRRWQVRRLGREGWQQVVGEAPALRDRSIPGAIPAAARSAMPALWDRKGIVCVPHLGFQRPEKSGKYPILTAVFSPAQRLTP